MMRPQVSVSLTLLSLFQVLKGFGELGPPRTDNEGSSTLSVYTGVAQGTEELIKHSSKQIVNRNKRLVVVTTGLELVFFVSLIKI